MVVAVSDRVGYCAFGDDTDDVTGPRPVNTAEDDSGAGTMAF
jgi:hypothetical protein